MATLRQKLAVKKIIENHGNISKSMKEVGYSEKTAVNPKNLTESDGYKEEVLPVLQRYQNELDAILKAMEIKDKNSEDYKTLVDAADKVQKQVQLLSGGATERAEVVPILGGETKKDDIQKNDSIIKDIETP